MSELVPLGLDGEMSVAMEGLLIDGDLSRLTSEQRVQYYKKTCDSLGLNYLTQPFAYIKLNGKLQLYTRKEATEQLRFIHKVSIYKMEKEVIDGVYVVTSYARTADGKEDVSTGAVTITGLKGELLANAFLKSETKSKRRVTLSLCGLGYLDETEVNSIPNAPLIDVNYNTGEILNSKEFLAPLNTNREELIKKINEATDMASLKEAYATAYRAHANRLDSMKDITEIKDRRVKELNNLINGEVIS